MPILEFTAGRSAKRRLLFTALTGLIFGLFFGSPPAYAWRMMGLPFTFSMTAILMGLLVGLPLAVLVVTYVFNSPLYGVRSSVVVEPILLSAPGPRRCGASLIASRLEEEKSHLDRLDGERGRRQDLRYDKRTEDRIIWSELLELELQDIDEQIDRMTHTAATTGGRQSIS